MTLEPSNNKPNDNFLSVKDFAILVRLKPTTIRKYIKNKQIAITRIGKRGAIRINTSCLKDFEVPICDQDG